MARVKRKSEDNEDEDDDDCFIVSPPPAKARRQTRCERCGCSVPPEDEESHALAHLQEDEFLGGAESPRAPSASIKCDRCGAAVPARSYDEHVAGHIQEEEYGRQQRDEREAAEFAALQARYGADERGSYREQYREHIERRQKGWKRARGDEAGQPPPPAPYSTSSSSSASSSSASASAVDAAVEAAIDGPDVETRLADVTSLLRGAYLRLAANPAARCLLAGPCDLFTWGPGDAGWGCGYRNLQILCSWLVRLPEYRPHLFDGSGEIPSLPRLQGYIEAAWRAGFDVEGAGQLNHRLAETRKWIGATEVAALLRFFGFRAKRLGRGAAGAWEGHGSGRTDHENSRENLGGIVDFVRPSQPPDRHAALLAWVWDYFQAGARRDEGQRPAALSAGAACVSLASVPPLYFQHDGHSRTVAGAERMGGEIALVLVDPGFKAATLRRQLAAGRWVVRKGWQALRRHRQYQASSGRLPLGPSARPAPAQIAQIVYLAAGEGGAAPLLMGAEERLASRRLDSTRIPATTGHWLPPQ
eukprot:tig00020629_g12364.t1